MVIQEPVQAAIWSCLNHYAYSDAIFLAERLYAEVGTDEALFLLATCYFRSGKPVRAYSLLQQRGCPTPQCRYLLAQCCLEINKLSEAESILAGNLLTKNKTHEDIINEFGDSSSYALRLLGKLYRRTERSGKAADHYRKSLKLNPFLWTSFEALCQLGENPDASKIFQVPAAQNISHMCQTTCQTPHGPPTTPTSTESTPVAQIGTRAQDIHTSSISNLQTPQMMITATTPDGLGVNMEMTPDSVRAPIPGKALVRSKSGPGHSLFSGLGNMSPLTPSFGVLMLEATPSPGQSQLNPSQQNYGTYITPSPVQTLIDSLQKDNARAPPRKPRFLPMPVKGPTPKGPVFSQSGNTYTIDLQTSSPQPGLQSSNNVQGVRRSSRLFSNASSSVKENNKSQSQKKFTSPKAPAKKSKTRSSKTQQELNELNKAEIMAEVVKPGTATNTQAQVLCMQKQSVEGLMSLLQGLGKAYASLAQFECNRALELFSELPPQHYNTGWVMCQVGRAHFEMAEHQKAERAFSAVRNLEPHHLEGMEIYSTTLWHLQREVHLSTLAQELTDTDKQSPEAWCATGNCFSLQKEHDVAIKFFQRAVQVDPNFAYAYTLLGHEYVLTEELDKAMSCFRNAIRVDPRHYNAWYGIGMIYYKQEKFALARVHFGKALTINRRSSVLLCHIAVVEHAMKKSDTALEILNKAIEVDPKNPLCKFHRASILFATDQHKEALAELEELKQIVPKESLVYFLIGKVHKKLGQTHLALMNFSWAMDLDPKGANNQIKEAIDKRYVTDEDDPTTGIEEDNGIEVEDPESSNNSSIVEAVEMQLQAIESDESL